MDALVRLALMTKAKLVFESADTFLSFPALMPLSYSPEKMKFADAASIGEMQSFSEFSVLTNALPPGVLFQPSLGRSLWDVYGDVLRAECAEGSLSAQQTADLDAARSFLYIQAADGLPQDSPSLVAYKQYRQVLFMALQDFKNQQLTVALSEDPNRQSLWKDSGEALARGEIQAAESEWESKGFKSQVEQAILVEQACTAGSPRAKWQTWRSQFSPDIVLLHLPTGESFAPTLFSPYDIVNLEWPTFTITGSEIAHLVEHAPAELTNILDVGTGSPTIESLSFDYCSVVVSRPWFRPEVFEARYWRFVGAETPLSDGKVPPEGQWPAYITALVFARNIVVRNRIAGAIQAQPVLTFPPLMLSRAIAEPPQGAIPAAVARPRPPIPLHSEGALLQTPRRAGPSPAVGPTVAPTALTAITPMMRARLSSAVFAQRQKTVWSLPPADGVPTQGQEHAGEISVLAFICKRLPKCPDPDPALNWG